jgi:O-antigen/teichoic acid export membrane protein
MATELAYDEPPSQLGSPSSVSGQFLTRLARGAVLAFVIQVAGAGLTYLSQVAFARWMGISQFGVYAYVTAWATILALLAGLGFPMSVLRFIPEYRTAGDYERVRGLIRMSRLATIAAGVAFALLGTAVALALGGKLAIAGVAFWLVPAGALITLDTSILRAGGRVVGAYAPALVARPLIIVLATGGVWLAWGRIGAETGLSITLAVFVAVVLLQSAFVRELARRGPSPRAVAYERKVWLRVSVPLFLVAGFQVALAQTDLVVVGAAGGVRDAAIYSAASKTATLVSFLLVALSVVTAPVFAELEAKGDRAGLQRLATISAHWVFWPTLLVAAGLAALSPLILDLFGPGFSIARGALLLLLFGQLVSAGCGAVGYLLGMTGHQDDIARVYGITAIINVALCYVGVRAFGLTGAAGASAVSLIAWNVWLHHLTTKRIGIRASILSALMSRRGS